MELQNNPKAQLLMSVLSSMPDARTFVEIGCIRNGKELASEGFSTIYLATESKRRSGEFYSIDPDPDANMVAMTALEAWDLSDSANVLWGKGAEWLSQFESPIDFLYLDGSGVPITTLEEFQAAEKNLHESSVVMIDDCHQQRDNKLGKGDLTIPYALTQGWSVILGPVFGEYISAVLRRGA